MNDTDLERTLHWIETIAQFYIEGYQDDQGNPRTVITIDKNYISAYGTIGIIFDGKTGKFIEFKIFE